MARVTSFLKQTPKGITGRSENTYLMTTYYRDSIPCQVFTSHFDFSQLLVAVWNLRKGFSVEPGFSEMGQWPTRFGCHAREKSSVYESGLYWSCTSTLNPCNHLTRKKSESLPTDEETKVLHLMNENFC